MPEEVVAAMVVEMMVEVVVRLGLVGVEGDLEVRKRSAQFQAWVSFQKGNQSMILLLNCQ